MFPYRQNMDATKSSLSASMPYPKPSSDVHTADSWQYQLAYEMEKLNELRRQVAAQEERFSLMQQQFETLSNDTTGWNCFPIDLCIVVIIENITTEKMNKL